MQHLVISTYRYCPRDDEPTDFPPINVEEMATDAETVADAAIEFIMEEQLINVTDAAHIVNDELELMADGSLMQEDENITVYTLRNEVQEIKEEQYFEAINLIASWLIQEAKAELASGDIEADSVDEAVDMMKAGPCDEDLATAIRELLK